MKPFERLDGRTDRCQRLRSACYGLMGGKDSYESATYMKKALAERAAFLMIQMQDMDESEKADGKAIQAINAFTGICKAIGSDVDVGQMRCVD